MSDFDDHIQVIYDTIYSLTQRIKVLEAKNDEFTKQNEELKERVLWLEGRCDNIIEHVDWRE